MRYVINKKAKPISYQFDPYKNEAVTRTYYDVQFIVIHNTGNVGDTAKNNVLYFSPSGGNTRSAGANFFVDQRGKIGKSIPIKNVAYHCGGARQSEKGGAYFNRCKNWNSVGIELCDIMDKAPSEKMIKSVKKLVKMIRKYCPNARTIIRHYDVNGKDCPHRFAVDGEAWKKFKKGIGGDI